MNEVIIERLDYLKTHKVYLADCKIIFGKILQNQVWHLKGKPKIKITFESPVLISSHNFNSKNRIVHYSILKPQFDLNLFDNPTTWIKE